ncbi:MAG: LysR family transcriptional regulator [Burkholderiales bacterium]|nr:LysR family transcriptional regulator [Burkholderiales bacterium]
MKIENLSDLAVLIHTARAGTLSAAARALGVTPAAASASLKRLEAQLGTRLFERSTRAMRLTQQGQLILDYATRAFELLAEAESQVDADKAALQGTVRVAAPSDLARTTLLPWIGEFLALHPGVKVSLTVSDRLLDVVRDEVDLAIRYGELRDSRVVARVLLHSRPLLCAAPSYLARMPPLTHPSELAAHNCLAFHRGGKPFRQWRFRQNDTWVEVNVGGDRSVDDASLGREWAVAGAGVILKTDVDVRHDLQSGALVRLLPKWEADPYPLHLVLPSSRFIPNRVRQFVDFLVQRFAQLAQENERLP